jgi:predicted metalloprotease with PDZ domain
MPRKTPPRKSHTVHFALCPSDPHGHTYAVMLHLDAPDPAGQVLSLPAWIAGSYMIREFAKNIVSIRAQSGGKEVALNKRDKHTWVAAPCNGALTIDYTVYAWDLSVRTAHLDATHGFFNGTSVFLRAHGFEACKHALDIIAPPGLEHWQIATSLPREKNKTARKTARGHAAQRNAAQQFGRFIAEDYDALIDHPVEMGTFAHISFTACGARHDMAFTGQIPRIDLPRIAHDVQKICAAQIKLFEPKTQAAPFLDSSDRYVFMTMAVGEGYGGLEHRASTALICNRADLPITGQAVQSEGYRQFLGLVSHEYFHTWNVKRIKPAVFAPYDLTQENYTPLLWLFEGFTSYYDDLMLVRAGVITSSDYLKSLSKTITSVLRAPGRTQQSVAQSSFDAWIKYYRQDENSPNAIVSYYAKGSLVALYLDLLIRTQTKHKKSLDDFMRLLWQRYGRDFYRGNAQGVAPQDIATLLQEATGCKLQQELALATESTQDLPLASLLALAGIDWHARVDKPLPSLGVRTKTAGGECVIATCWAGEAAHRAGLSAGDVLVAVDGLRVNSHNLEALLARYPAQAMVDVHVFRRDELMRLAVQLDAPQPQHISLSINPDARKAQVQARTAWLWMEG